MIGSALIQRDVDLLLIVPPFAQIETQSMAAHIMQALARKQQLTAQVLYANMDFAARFPSAYSRMYSMDYNLNGERVFMRSAHTGKDSPAPEFPENKDSEFLIHFYPSPEAVTLSELKEMEQYALTWPDDYVFQTPGITRTRIAGITASFEQTNAAYALLKRIKKQDPSIITLIGGFNCEGDMAEGIASLEREREERVIDYIFSGESETSFLEFLERYKNDDLPSERIIRSSSPYPMDELPLPDYTDYFEQLKLYHRELYQDRSQIALSFESSRGCFRGEHTPCRFCGYDPARIHHRRKSPMKLIEQLNSLAEWKTRNVVMADLAMPPYYQGSFLPELARFIGEGKMDIHLYYEQRVFRDYHLFSRMKQAGMKQLQPGIESLSDPLLKLMNKGNTLRDNIIFLRNCRSHDMEPHWNFVWGIPGEKVTYYNEMLESLPLVAHLSPPVGLFRLSLTRFSEYFNHPEKYRIQQLRPVDAYYDVFPPGTDHYRIGLVFQGQYSAETFDHMDVIQALHKAIENWSGEHSFSLLAPVLDLRIGKDGEPVVIDTRKLSGNSIETSISFELARCIVNADSHQENVRRINQTNESWCIPSSEGKVSLITVSPEVIDYLEMNSGEKIHE